jgi:hypothetical protein
MNLNLSNDANNEILIERIPTFAETAKRELVKIRNQFCLLSNWSKIYFYCITLDFQKQTITLLILTIVYFTLHYFAEFYVYGNRSLIQVQVLFSDYG